MVYIIPQFIIISYISIFVCRFCNKTDKYITYTHSHTNTEITDQSIPVPQTQGISDYKFIHNFELCKYSLKCQKSK